MHGDGDHVDIRSFTGQTIDFVIGVLTRPDDQPGFEGPAINDKRVVIHGHTVRCTAADKMHDFEFVPIRDMGLAIGRLGDDLQIALYRDFRRVETDFTQQTVDAQFGAEFAVFTIDRNVHSSFLSCSHKYGSAAAFFQRGGAENSSCFPCSAA